MNFSDKLKEIRKNEGLSQEQLAEKIGVSRQAITKWETGKGLPDIENMVILAEIFKTTIDELVSATAAKAAQEEAYVSETVYDIDCEKHFDINIGSASSVTLLSGKDEKLHIVLSSDTYEELGSAFKIKLNEKRNRLDIDCINKNKVSRFEAEDSVSIVITMPEKYSDHCEVEADVKFLEINSLNIRRLEFDGKADRINISQSSGSLEFTAKTDYDITVDRIKGQLDVNQFRAKTVVHLAEENCPRVVNKGRKCSVYFLRDGSRSEESAGSADDENILSISGICSELIVDLK